MDEQPVVSIIIPTFNAEKTLGRCIQSIKNQSYRNFEITVVDNYSSDKTADICKTLGVKFFVSKGERTNSKNLGLKNAKGKYVCFIDCDMELTPKVIEECLNKIENSDTVGGVLIPERSVGNSFWVKVRDFERSFYLDTEVESARFFRKDLAKEVGGFDENVIFFEESVLAQRIENRGYDVKVRIDSPILHHEDDFSLWKWLGKKFYYGKTAGEYLRRYSTYGKRQMSLIYRYRIFLREKRFASRPVLAFGVLLLKTLEYLFAGLGYLSHKLKG